jgi:transposase
MTRGEEIPEWLRNQIVGMRRTGKKYTEIERETTVNANTCQKIYTRWQETGTCDNAPRTGAPKKVDEYTIRCIKKYIRSNRETRRMPLKDITEHVDANIYDKTMRKVIEEIGMGHCVERKRCWLSKEQKAKRLRWAKELLHWTAEDWKKVCFSDEMGMQTGPNGKRVYVWRYPEEEYDEDCTGAIMIQRFEKVKVWGYMRFDKLSQLIFLPEYKG